MLKYFITSIVLAAISAPLIIYISNMTLYAIGWIMAVVAAVLMFVFIVSMIGVKFKKKPSPWKLFAVGDIVLIVIALGLSLIDSMFSKGLGAGLLAAILLYYGMPILVGVLIVELLAYRIYRMYVPEEDNAPEPEKKLPPKIVIPERTEPVQTEEQRDFTNSTPPAGVYSLGALPKDSGENK